MCLIFISAANLESQMLVSPVCFHLLIILSFIWVCICYILIYKNIKKSKTRLASFAKEKVKQNIPVHFILITFSNSLCWAPVSITSILTMVGYNISSEVLIAIISVAIPINSILNPLFYTITTKAFAQRS